MLIEITEKDIKDGYPKNIQYCPLGLAAHRVFSTRVMVDGARLYVYDSRNIEIVYTLPEEISNWVSDYDNGKDVNPVSFELEEP